jgi:hypothetical protein
MKSITIVVISLVFLLSGCVENNPAVPPPTKSSPIRLTENKNTVTPPIKTKTPTATEFFTPTWTSLPTWTNLPTWSIENGQTALLGILEGNDQCRLPCFGGITPGLTNWEESLHYLSPLVGMSKSDISTNTNCDFGDCNAFTWYYSPQALTIEGGVYVILPENKVHFLSVETFGKPFPKGMSIKDILNTYGQPTMILMDVNPNNTFEGGVEGATLLILLDYSKDNFLVIFHRQAELVNGNYVSCVNEDTSQLMVFDNGKPLETFETLTNLPDVARLRVFGWREIQEVAHLSVSSFFEQFKGNNIPCISTSSDIWRY